MNFFDNIKETVKDDLQKAIKENCKISVAASCFSIYAYEELRKEFENVSELRFLFTSPTFTTEKSPKDKREFYIPRLDRERNLYGSAFELKLRNELSQKAIARECAAWIRRKVIFKSNITQNNAPGFIHVKEKMDLDDYINLKSRVETRMKITILSATGDDDLINEEEKGALEYRRKQLKKLQEEVVDLEDMSDGISIMDLGLNEFRLDLLEYQAEHGDIDKVPFGMHAVVPANDEAKQGVIYILKNINNGVNIDNQNRLHPFYMVYISKSKEVICNHLQPKKMLDFIRFMCKGVKDPYLKLCETFNKETRDGRKMDEYSTLLEQSISSIINVKEESDLDSFFTSSETSALTNKISGLNDFELICFMVVK